MKGEVYAPSNWIMYKAAELHYIEGKDRKEIASILHVSDSTLSRLLKRAHEEKIVEFKINRSYEDALELGGRIKDKYNLVDALVIPVPPGAEKDPEKVKKIVALEGARYLQRIMTHNDVLGIAWGGTMYYLINYLNPCRRSDNTFITLHGSLSCCDYELDVKTLVHRMSMAFGGSYVYMLPPGLQEVKKETDQLRLQEKDIFALFKRITISISGIGSFYPEPTSPLSRIQYLKAHELELLQKQGVYCDLMLRFLDKNGRECDTGIRDRTLAIELETYKRIPCKIIAASGKEKAYALRAVLRGKLADVIIIDNELARRALELDSQD